MINLTNFFTKGLKHTLLLKNNGGFSHNGPWQSLSTNAVIDRWHVNDFSSVEYTICADFDSRTKEIVKLLVTATAEDAHIVEYARNNTNIEIMTIDALVNNSYVDIVVGPKIAKLNGAKILFTAQYFQNQSLM